MKLLMCPQDQELVRSIVSKLDYSAALVPDATEKLLAKTCDEAMLNGYAAVAVFPSCIQFIVSRLQGSKVNPQIAVGFPCGDYFTETKLLEAKIGLDIGVKEIDMVMNISKFLEGQYNYVENEIHQIVEMAKPYNVGVKTIIEIGFLNDEQKCKAAQLAVSAGAMFVKTCTGFGPGRATVHDILLLKQTVGESIKIKASGSVSSLEDALTFIECGASRVAGRTMFTDQLIKIGYQP